MNYDTWKTTDPADEAPMPHGTDVADRIERLMMDWETMYGPRHTWHDLRKLDWNSRVADIKAGLR